MVHAELLRFTAKKRRICSPIKHCEMTMKPILQVKIDSENNYQIFYYGIESNSQEMYKLISNTTPIANLNESPQTPFR